MTDGDVAAASNELERGLDPDSHSMMLREGVEATAGFDTGRAGEPCASWSMADVSGRVGLVSTTLKYASRGRMLAVLATGSSGGGGVATGGSRPAAKAALASLNNAKVRSAYARQ